MDVAANACSTSLGPKAGPPAGFNPLTATDAELACHFFPPRPKNDPVGLATWTDAMTHALHWVPAVVSGTGAAPTTSRSLTIQPDSFPPNNGPAIWAGYVANVSSYSIWGQWTMPDEVNTDYPHETTDWVGLGGLTQSQSVFQAGTALTDGSCNILHQCSPAAKRFFWDHPPEPEHYIDPSVLPVDPGDHVYVDAFFTMCSWFTPYPAPCAEYFLQNATKNMYTYSFDQSSTMSYPNVDWEEEDSCVSSYNPQLHQGCATYSPPYNEVQFHNLGFISTNGPSYTLNNAPAGSLTPKYMGQNGVAILVPTTPGNDLFTVCNGSYTSPPSFTTCPN